MKKKILLILTILVFVLGFTAQLNPVAADPVIVVNQPCLLHSSSLAMTNGEFNINPNRTHWDGDGKAVDLNLSGANVYQRCQNTTAIASISGVLRIREQRITTGTTCSGFENVGTRATAYCDFGYMAIIDGPDFDVLYGHLVQGSVMGYGFTDGQNITVGDAFATMGATGNADGVHIHFEVRTNSLATRYTYSQWKFTKDECVKPASGDWYIAVDCRITTTYNAPADVYVIDGATLTIENGGELNVDLATKKFVVYSDSTAIIRSLGKLH